MIYKKSFWTDTPDYDLMVKICYDYYYDPNGRKLKSGEYRAIDENGNEIIIDEKDWHKYVNGLIEEELIEEYDSIAYRYEQDYREELECRAYDWGMDR